jgi:NAD(P)-dependent dehydrogenase (short-subunit alcohol dehydrogenase family)
LVTRSSFDRSTAVITGGASGIGAALGAALVAAGARVVLADIDADGLASTVEALAASGGSVVGCELDVTDRDAFGALIDQVAAREGVIDYVFNNAGISLGGPTHEQSAAHWDRIIQTNLVGVVNGVLAAYPLMIEQGHGHIVNTASAAGLASPPFVVAYATTKHAVVGLTTALRPEAAMHGVRVSVLCPGAVETAILDVQPPADLPATASLPVTARAYLERLHQRPISAERFARIALRDISRNRAISVIPRSAKAFWYLQRVSPALAERASTAMANVVADDLVKPRQTESGA